MARSLLIVFLSLLLPVFAIGQVRDGKGRDSTMLLFNSGPLPQFVADISSTPLWQIGHSYKTFFGVDASAQTTMITDTLNPYKKNADNWFIIKGLGFFTIVDFWHTYQTTSGYDGGIVEFSNDSGRTWQNVKGDCNSDGGGQTRGVLTSNFYAATDTLLTGQPAFSGTQGLVQLSRIQFYPGPILGPAGSGGCDFKFPYTFDLRFRFLSDSTSDTLAGWQIDSIKFEEDYYGFFSVARVNKQKLPDIFPNPSHDGVFHFPVLNNEHELKLEVYNSIGSKVLTRPYSHLLDLGNYEKGLYLYRVTDGIEYFSGQLIVE